MTSMKSSIAFFTFLIISTTIYSQEKFTIAFGSCNDQNKSNPFWEDIISLQPDVWIWGGDNIYADTNNMDKMEKLYMQQKKQFSYSKLAKNTPILATWDDHDYGKNDGGIDYKKKKESQQLFLDFINVPKHSPRRKKAGIYHVENFKIKV
ncbi:alkaline phosphatase D family protein [Tenacibaculum ovolyticum]|uniref:alkaline phosphatase D family protein n=1 Tax=Tenacibaculum ovolyticum TaxID=104270 RepID=UPI000402D528|nr:alkaline phosphatase D family protein [Tenacibaculum ovolyticum]